MSIYLPIQLSQILTIYKKEYQLSLSDRNDGTNDHFYYLMLIRNLYDDGDDMCCYFFLYDYYFLYEGEKFFVRVYMTSSDRAYPLSSLCESQGITFSFFFEMTKKCLEILNTKYIENKNKPWEDARNLIQLALAVWDN